MREKKLLDLDGEWVLYTYPDEVADRYEALLAGDVAPACVFSEPIAAQVPGSYELDLQRAGRIPDPYVSMNMQGLEEYEYAHFVYVKEFSFSDEVTGEELLSFEGIDTFSTVYLNGVEIGKTENMLIGHELAATSLRRGDNRLTVHIEPTVLKAREKEYTLLCRNFKYIYDNLHVRKSPSMFGWDILPRMLSGGIWRSVSLIRRKGCGFSQAFLYTTSASPEEAELELFYELQLGRERASRLSVEVSGRCGESVFFAKTRVWGKAGRENIPVSSPRLWWPRGYGEPALYETSVRLLRDGEVIDERRFLLGIRTVSLRRTEALDENGNGDFQFLINGEPVFLKGTNWVPPDAHHALGDVRAPEILEQALDVGCNAIRIWGGSRYELDSFYTLCDRKGVFVWQDFIMACGNYPQTPEFCEGLRREITWVVRRLRQHPSICLWAGDNECDQNYEKQLNFTNPNDNLLTRQVIYQTLLNEDYTRPYLPSSPYLNEECYRAWMECAPENHLWGERKYYKGPYYKDAKALFASEMGYHGCPAPESLRQFISPEKLWSWDNEEWLLHASSPDPKEGEPFAYRNRLMASQVERLFGKAPENLEDFALASQISQAEAMQFLIQHFRSRKGHCTGYIWWNIRDGWPQISDAVMDYYGRRKLAYTYIKRCQQPVCLMMEEREEGVLSLYGVNDTRQAQVITYSVEDAGGNTILAGEATLPTERAVLLETVCDKGDQGLWKLRWKAGEQYGENSHLTGKPPYSLEQYVWQANRLGLLQPEGFSAEGQILCLGND